MKVLFLVTASLTLISSAHARKNPPLYICDAEHNFSRTAFYLNPNKLKEVQIGDQQLFAQITEYSSGLEVTLGRAINIMDVPYKKKVQRLYPHGTKKIRVELQHSFGGKEDIFKMTCFPKSY